MSNEPVAIVLNPNGRKVKAYKIKPRQNYFIIYKPELKGIFEVNSKHHWNWGKTPVYFVHIKNSMTIDPVAVSELNRFAKKNSLTKIKRKHIREGSVLRRLGEKFGSNRKAVEEVQKEKQVKLDMEVEGAQREMKQKLEQYNRDNNAERDLTDAEQQIYILEYLRNKNKIEKEDYIALSEKIQKGAITLPELVEELRRLEVIEINVPLDLDVETFIEDTNAQNPFNLIALLNQLRIEKKGLGGMTAVPVKSFIPASMIFAVLVGGAIAFIAIFNSGVLEQFGFGDIGFSLPGFGFIDYLKSFING